MKITEITLNDKNPRYISEEKMAKLVNSIKTFEKMMALRPIVVDENNIIIGGNMRYRALLEMGYTDLPAKWVTRASDLTPEERNEFIIKDNISFGGWDMETIANEWDAEELEGWGMDLDMPDVEKDAVGALDDNDATLTFCTQVMQARNRIAEGIQKAKNILLSDAHIEAEALIFTLLEANEYYTG